MTKRTLHGPNGLRILLDSNEIYPNDPGNGTPAIVQLFGFSATYGCAADTGELTDKHGEDRELTTVQLNWLQSDTVENAVNSFIDDNS